MDNVGTKIFSLAICLPKYNHISLIFSYEADTMLHQLVLVNIYICVEKLSMHLDSGPLKEQEGHCGVA